jgi:hypothetical protein
MDEKVREYLARNGAKGGHAGKGTELRRQLNRAAVQARWAKVKAAGQAKPSPKAKRKSAAANKSPKGDATTPPELPL